MENRNEQDNSWEPEKIDEQIQQDVTEVDADSFRVSEESDENVDNRVYASNEDPDDDEDDDDDDDDDDNDDDDDDNDDEEDADEDWGDVDPLGSGDGRDPMDPSGPGSAV